MKVTCPACEGGIDKPGCHTCNATGTVSPTQAVLIRQMWADNQAAFEERCRQAVGIADECEPSTADKWTAGGVADHDAERIMQETEADILAAEELQNQVAGG